MHFPQRVPGLKLLLVVWGVYTAVWISLEGALWRCGHHGCGDDDGGVGSFVAAIIGREDDGAGERCVGDGRFWAGAGVLAAVG